MILINSIIEIVWHTSLLLVVLLIITRLLGRRTLAELTFFDFVVGVTIGNIAASLVSDKTANIFEIVVSLATATLWVLTINFLSMKSLPARKLLEDQPIVVIYKGQILEDNLKQRYYNINDLLELLREQEVFSPSEVEVALIETDGALSILKKPSQAAVTDGSMPQAMASSLPFSNMVGRELIIDGKIIPENLKLAKLTQKDLMTKLTHQGITQLEDVMLGLLTPSGELYIDQKQDHESDLLRRK